MQEVGGERITCRAELSSQPTFRHISLLLLAYTLHSVYSIPWGMDANFHYDYVTRL